MNPPDPRRIRELETQLQATLQLIERELPHVQRITLLLGDLASTERELRRHPVLEGHSIRPRHALTQVNDTRTKAAHLLTRALALTGPASR